MKTVFVLEGTVNDDGRRMFGIEGIYSTQAKAEVAHERVRKTLMPGDTLMLYPVTLDETGCDPDDFHMELV